jgi:NitT/TauT family transport system permease protein
VKRYLVTVAQLTWPLVLFLLLWQLTVAQTTRGRFFYSSPYEVALQLWTDLYRGPLLHDTAITAAEAFCGFLLGSTLGSLIGLALWLSESLALTLRPYVAVLGSVPVFAIAPMTIIWFGTGFFAKLMMALLSTVFAALAQAYDGARTVQASQLFLMRSLRASRWQVYSTVVVPSSLAWVMSSYRINVGLGILGAFLGEVISSDAGLGHYVMRASALYDTSRVLAGITCLIIVAGVLYAVVGLVDKLFFPWASKERLS